MFPLEGKMYVREVVRVCFPLVSPPQVALPIVFFFRIALIPNRDSYPLHIIIAGIVLGESFGRAGFP